MSFQNANNFTLPVYGNLNQVDNSNQIHYHTNGSAVLKPLIDAACLQASHEAVEFVDRPKCHPDTRIAVTNDIMAWVASSNSEKGRMLWLTGPAGAGKSAIFQTVAQTLSSEDKLISSFFFSRTAGNTREYMERLVPTIVYHLMLAVPEVKEYILGELERDPQIFTYVPMEGQYKRLVIGPLSRIAEEFQMTLPCFVLVDGLDECRDKNNQEDSQARVIKMFANANGNGNVNIRYLIASRPELDIRNAFNDSLISGITTKLVLDDNYKPDDDIRRYLVDEFAIIKQTHAYTALYQSEELHWPSNSDLITLVNRSVTKTESAL